MFKSLTLLNKEVEGGNVLDVKCLRTLIREIPQIVAPKIRDSVKGDVQRMLKWFERTKEWKRVKKSKERFSRK